MQPHRLPPRPIQPPCPRRFLPLLHPKPPSSILPLALFLPYPLLFSSHPTAHLNLNPLSRLNSPLCLPRKGHRSHSSSPLHYLSTCRNSPGTFVSPFSPSFPLPLLSASPPYTPTPQPSVASSIPPLSTTLPLASLLFFSPFLFLLLAIQPPHSVVVKGMLAL
ncbi:unnamed protein product [Closterium sp. NIES-53]